MAASNIEGTSFTESGYQPSDLVNALIGMTLHSWGAIAPTVDNIDKLIKYIRTARPALLRWKTTQILIIDEGTLFNKSDRIPTELEKVSMVDGHLFEKIAAIATQLREKTDKPFGGIQVESLSSGSSSYSDNYLQLVVTGDFFQLPPVTEGSKQPFFAFECDAWKASIEHTVSLTRVFRQKDNSSCFWIMSQRWNSVSHRVCSTFERTASGLYHSARDRVLSCTFPSHCFQQLGPSADRTLLHTP